jgi:hypothetical protein
MRGIHIPFKRDFESPPVDISEIFSFEITAYPPTKSKLKYKNLQRQYDGHGLILYEDEYNQGVYHLENVSSLIEAKVTVPHNLWDEQTKTYEITFTCNDIPFKYNQCKRVVDLATEISSRTRWTHKIVWITDDGPKIEWKNSDLIYQDGKWIKSE